MTATLTDGQLLREFALSRNERSFQDLVQRHQDMVFSTALRRTGQPELAADVAQNVFLALATKAAVLSSRASVGGWLYKSTLLEAARRQRDEIRRAQRERRYAEESHISTTDPHAMNEAEEARHRRELMPVLDDAMSDLAEPDREALVLRFMRGLSLRETGAALGTTEEAARKRVARALEKLSALFRRRGLPASAAVLAVTVLPEAVKAAPAGLSASLSAVAAQVPATGPGGVLLLKAVALTKPQLLAVCAAVAMVPVSWQAHRIGQLKSENATLASLLVVSSPASPSRHPDQRVTARSDEAAGTDSAGGPPALARPAERREGRGDRRAKMEHWRGLQRQQQRDARLAALQEQLVLEHYQVAAIAEATDAAEQDLKAMHGNNEADGTGRDPGAILAQRDQTIAAVLDAEQYQEYEAFLADEERGNREILANRLLGEVQTTLHLTDSQKDQLFALFATDPALTRRAHIPFPVEAANEDLNEKMAGIFSEEQWRLWQQRTGVWAQLFGAGDRGQDRVD